MCVRMFACTLRLCCVGSLWRRSFCDIVFRQRGGRNHLVGRYTLQTRLPVQKRWVVLVSTNRVTLMFSCDLYFKEYAHTLTYMQRGQQIISREASEDDTEGGSVRTSLHFQLLILRHVSTCSASQASLIISFSTSFTGLFFHVCFSLYHTFNHKRISQIDQFSDAFCRYQHRSSDGILRQL